LANVFLDYQKNIFNVNTHFPPLIPHLLQHPKMIMEKMSADVMR